MNLPPLPPVLARLTDTKAGHHALNDLVRAYGQQCRAAALEEAALICESENEGWHSDANAAAAQKIRRLK